MLSGRCKSGDADHRSAAGSTVEGSGKKPGDFSAWLAMLCEAAGSAARVSSAPPNADDLTEGAITTPV